MHALALLAGRGGPAAAYDFRAFLAVKFPPVHPNAGMFESHRRYWLNWFSHARDYRRRDKPVDKTRGRKGFVLILLGDVKQFNRRERKERKENQALWRTDAITCRVRTPFPSSPLLCDPCVLCG